MLALTLVLLVDVCVAVISTSDMAGCWTSPSTIPFGGLWEIVVTRGGELFDVRFALFTNANNTAAGLLSTKFRRDDTTTAPAFFVTNGADERHFEFLISEETATPTSVRYLRTGAAGELRYATMTRELPRFVNGEAFVCRVATPAPTPAPTAARTTTTTTSARTTTTRTTTKLRTPVPTPSPAAATTTRTLTATTPRVATQAPLLSPSSASSEPTILQTPVPASSALTSPVVSSETMQVDSTASINPTRDAQGGPDAEATPLVFLAIPVVILSAVAVAVGIFCLLRKRKRAENEKDNAVAVAPTTAVQLSEFESARDVNGHGANAEASARAKSQYRPAPTASEIKNLYHLFRSMLNGHD